MGRRDPHGLDHPGKQQVGRHLPGQFLPGRADQNDLLGLQIYGRATQRDEDNIYDGFRKRNTNSVTAKLALTPNRDHDIVLEATTAR